TVVISALCFVPPGVHLITGPLSPVIGGFFAGHRYKLNSGEAAIVGLVLAVVIGIPAPWVLKEVPYFGLDLPTITLIFLSIVGVVWFGFLGGVMAAVGGGMARKDEMTNDSHLPEKQN
ncbi:MAG TPA: DUF5518 domain-containing protein, partial [Thermomicrobiaceae bacterium]|nr:DUF5518 domain-containing protein [Thermomicrobiaceae bacterium]